ncbi:3D domain-containing protein [Dellaglioa sp. P0083]|uniref:3D domain-containing protein n=1 Tax=Dellaglioa kimchii TaxID=3344667 RepID=UPI0038D3C5A9
MKIRNIIGFTAVILCLLGGSVSVSATSISDLKKQESAAQVKVTTANSKISKSLTSINDEYAKIDKLNQEISDKEKKIGSQDKSIGNEQKQLDTRIENAKDRLRSLQVNDSSSKMVTAILEAKNAGDFISRVYAVSVLQSADNKTMKDVAANIKTMEDAKAHLESEQKSLKLKQSETKQETKEMNKQLAALKDTLGDAKKDLAKVTKAKDAELSKKAREAKAKADAKAAAAAKKEAAKKAESDDSSDKKGSTDQKASNDTSGKSTKKTLQMVATAYSTNAPGMGTHGSYGLSLLTNPQQIAVDPSVIPLGTVVWVSGYGVAIAGDTGSAIKGNRIDVHFISNARCYTWGKKTVTVKVLE